MTSDSDNKEQAYEHIQESIRTSLAVPISATQFDEWLGVMPPVYGKGCYGMGEVYRHLADDTEVRIWFTKSQCFVGTQAEAEQALAAKKSHRKSKSVPSVKPKTSK